MSKEYYTLREQIDNNGGLLNDESLHFIARHGLLCELLLCDNRLGEGAFLALPAMGYAPNSNELVCYLYMCDALDCKIANFHKVCYIPSERFQKIPRCSFSNFLRP